MTALDVAVQIDVDMTIQTAVKDFQMANAGAAVNFFNFANAQRDYKINGGFVDTVNGCETQSSDRLKESSALADCVVSDGIRTIVIHLMPDGCGGCLEVAATSCMIQVWAILQILISCIFFLHVVMS